MKKDMTKTIARLNQRINTLHAQLDETMELNRQVFEKNQTPHKEIANILVHLQACGLMTEKKLAVLLDSIGHGFKMTKKR